MSQPFDRAKPFGWAHGQSPAITLHINSGRNYCFWVAMFSSKNVMDFLGVVSIKTDLES
jgi:hypothetical protein